MVNAQMSLISSVFVKGEVYEVCRIAMYARLKKKQKKKFIYQTIKHQ